MKVFAVKLLCLVISVLVLTSSAQSNAGNTLTKRAKLVFTERFSEFPGETAGIGIPECECANRPWNYDSLLEFACENYDPGVDAEQVVNRFCNQVYLWNINNPDKAVPYTETVTKFTIIADKESGGRDWAVGDKNTKSTSHGTLQLRKLDRPGKMRKMGLDFNNEDHRVYYCCMMVATNGYNFSPWSVTRRYKREINNYYTALLNKE